MKLFENFVFQLIDYNKCFFLFNEKFVKIVNENDRYIRNEIVNH